MVSLHSLTETAQIPTILYKTEGSQMHGLREKLGVGATESDCALRDVVDTRSVEELRKGGRTQNPGVAQRRLLRIAAVVDIVQITTNQQTRHLRTTLLDQLKQRKAAARQRDDS